MNNPEEIGPTNSEQKESQGPEREKLKEIAERSKQFVVISGPSGSGKTMVIKYLIENYGFIEPPFVTTRELRAGEKEIGGVFLSSEEFENKEANQRVFLPARNYGNAYGYDLDIIFDLAVKDSYIVVEAPASNLASDVARSLPESTIIGMLPESRKELETQLTQRGLNDEEDRKIRLQNSEIEKEQILRASDSIDITQIVPTHGVPQDTIFQIDKLMGKKGFKKITE